jgi:3'-5' exoribonuclease
MKTKAGKDYINVRLQDKTGILEAKVWDMHKEIGDFEEKDFVKVEGMVITYQNGKQLNVYRVRKAEDHEYNLEDYIPSTEYDIEEMYDEFKLYISQMKDKNIKQLAEDIFVNDEQIAKLFKGHSAAKSMHHNYFGGLLEHTLNIIRICKFAARNYKGLVNEDLIVISAMLHDIGKVYELTSFPYNDYSDIGQLVGHMVIAVELVTEKTRNIKDFPEELKNLIKHSILAHHGELEYGSPKVPSTIEALILHFADNMDSKVKVFEEGIKNAKTEDVWVGYNRMMNRNIRKSEF